MKKYSFVVLFLLVLDCLVFGQVSESTKHQIIQVYTAYAESASASERLRFIRNADTIKEVVLNYYGDRSVGYIPKRFGDCTEQNGLYTLIEYMEGRSGLRGTVEIPQSRYFVKVGNEFKLDWESSVCFNHVSWAEFEATKSSSPVIMRCTAALGESRYDEYWGIKIYDNIPNYKFIAYLDKSAPFAGQLFDLLKDGRTYRIMFELSYVNGRYGKEVVITNFIQRGWFQE
jgi:hypothetical protein